MAHDANAHLDTAAADSGVLSQYQKESEKGAANGYASLDGSTLIPDAQIPATIARDSELHADIHADAKHTYPREGFNRLKSGLYYPTTGFSASVTPTLDELRLCPFPVAKTATIDRIGVWCQVGLALSEFRLGIYRDDGSGYPGARVLDAGTVAMTSQGFKEITISQELTPDLYWIGGAGQVAVATMTIATGAPGNSTIYPLVGMTAAPTAASSHGNGGFLEAGVSGALPANFTTTKTNSGSLPRVFLRVV